MCLSPGGHRSIDGLEAVWCVFKQISPARRLKCPRSVPWRPQEAFQVSTYP